MPTSYARHGQNQLGSSRSGEHLLQDVAMITNVSTRGHLDASPRSGSDTPPRRSVCRVQHSTVVYASEGGWLAG